MSFQISNNQPQQPHQLNQNKLFDLTSYGYDLPEDLIAQSPLKQRDQARLMVINRHDQSIVSDTFLNLDKYLPKQSVLVVNNSKVIPARLKGKRVRNGLPVEIFLLKQIDEFHFEALLKPLKRIHEGEPIDIGFGVNAFLVNRDKRIVRFDTPNLIAKLEEVGHIPLPPYIKRDDNLDDKNDYQTVYANPVGSVAAPTAGLHFTDNLITQLKANDHPFLTTTLHIGYGTFKPVENNDIRQHAMHAETYQVDRQVYQLLTEYKKAGRKIVAVGTTSCRVLETIGANQQLQGDTNIFIYPGYQFKMIDALITNFHLPYSTLIMLVSAFGGYELIRKAYAIAVREKYRFFSYGDAMLIV